MPGTLWGAGDTQMHNVDNILVLREPILLWEETDENQIYPTLGSDNTMTLEILRMLFGNNKTPSMERRPVSSGQPGWALVSLSVTFVSFSYYMV